MVIRPIRLSHQEPLRWKLFNLDHLMFHQHHTVPKIWGRGLKKSKHKHQILIVSGDHFTAERMKSSRKDDEEQEEQQEDDEEEQEEQQQDEEVNPGETDQKPG